MRILLRVCIRPLMSSMSGFVHGWLQLVVERHGVDRRECVVNIAVVAYWTARSEVGNCFSDRSGICVRLRMRILLRVCIGPVMLSLLGLCMVGCSLSSNDMGSAGTSALSTSLSSLTGLQHLE